MNDIERREIQEAISAADDALRHLQSAKKYLGSAGNWGLLGIHNEYQKPRYVQGDTYLQGQTACCAWRTDGGIFCRR